MDYVFIKVCDQTILNQEFRNYGLLPLINSISIGANLITINTKRKLSSKEERILYNIILNHQAPIQSSNLTSRITGAIQFGQQILLEFASENIVRGYTTDQISEMIRKYGYIMMMLQSGSLYTVLGEIEKLNPDELIDPSRKQRLIKRLKDFLGIV